MNAQNFLTGFFSGAGNGSGSGGGGSNDSYVMPRGNNYRPPPSPPPPPPSRPVLIPAAPIAAAAKKTKKLPPRVPAKPRLKNYEDRKDLRPVSDQRLAETLLADDPEADGTKLDSLAYRDEENNRVLAHRKMKQQVQDAMLKDEDDDAFVKTKAVSDDDDEDDDAMEVDPPLVNADGDEDDDYDGDEDDDEDEDEEEDEESSLSSSSSVAPVVPAAAAPKKKRAPKKKPPAAAAAAPEEPEYETGQPKVKQSSLMPGTKLLARLTDVAESKGREDVPGPSEADEAKMALEAQEDARDEFYMHSGKQPVSLVQRLRQGAPIAAGPELRRWQEAEARLASAIEHAVIYLDDDDEAVEN